MDYSVYTLLRLYAHLRECDLGRLRQPLAPIGMSSGRRKGAKFKRAIYIVLCCVGRTELGPFSNLINCFHRLRHCYAML